MSRRKVITHELYINGEWLSAECYQFVNRRRGLPQWGYLVHDLQRTVKGSEMEQMEEDGFVRKVERQETRPVPDFIVVDGVCIRKEAVLSIGPDGSQWAIHFYAPGRAHTLQVFIPEEEARRIAAELSAD